VTLRVGELLLPNIPAGKLDARFGVLRDTLDVERLDFAAPGALALNGKGRIEQLSAAPAGRVDFSLQAATADSLRIAADLFGLPASVGRSQHLAALAPLNVKVGLVAAREGDATNASITLGGKAGASDVMLVGRALGDSARPGDAKVAVDGSVTGQRPEAFLVLLFPELPVERLAAAGQTQGKLTLKLAGVPNAGVTGKAALETGSMGVAFAGQGSLRPGGFTFAGKGAMVGKDASQALTLIGFEAPPSAAGIPLQLRFGLTKQGSSVDVSSITGMIAGQEMNGNAHFEIGGAKTRFALTGSADTISLPSLLGVLVAWHRTPSTEEMLGSIGNGASEVWPARGFSLGPIEKSEGSISLKANTMTLGSSLKIHGAALAASVGKEGLSITDLTGRLFGGEFAYSGTLSPRGNGAELTARADVKGGKLEDFAASVTGSNLAKGPFDLAFAVQGEGLSPPGLVAGLGGQGTLALGAGTLQALTPDPLRRVAATAAKKTVNADKDEIAAQAQSVRDKITKGSYKFAPVQFAFDIKNGTLRLTPATLTGANAETKINGYLELASLKLDSEWALSLAGSRNSDVPPVSLVFTGALNKAGEISPAVDTAAIEAYLTMRRMQEGVEQLETLDVSGNNPPIEAGPEETAAVPIEPEPEPEQDIAAQPEPPSTIAEAEAPKPAFSARAMPSATEFLRQGGDDTVVPDVGEFIPPPKFTPAAAAPVDQPAAVKPAPAPSLPADAMPRAVAPIAEPVAPAPKAPAAAAVEQVPPAPRAATEPSAVAPKAPPAAAIEPPPAAAALAEPQSPSHPAAATSTGSPPLPEPKPTPAATPAEENPPAEPQTEAAVTPQAEPVPPIEEIAPVQPKPAVKRRKKRPVEPPDAWKKSIPLFGGG
jgi:hypothetical protein